VSLIVVAEGHGETEAIRNIVSRVASDDSLILPFIPRVGGVQRRIIRTRGRIEEACEIAMARDATALLLTRDADNDETADETRDCPKVRAPETAEWARAMHLPFPVAVVLFRWEYESMFLAGLDAIAGKALIGDDGIERPGVLSSALFHGDADHAPRGAKEWLTANMPRGVSYKPTTDQLAMTRLLPLDHDRLNKLPSFVRLRRGLRFLSENMGVAGAVYPLEGWT
jgi:hypothetical protein